jgi:exopolysaccharide biosynthesis polyprenyl glycosylphosphotransferase
MARSHFDSQVVWMAAADLVCLGVGIVCGVVVRLGPEYLREYVFSNIYGWIYFAGSVVLANYVVGTYGLEIRASRFNLLVNWVFSIAVALLVVSVTSYGWLDFYVGRGVLALVVAVYSVLWLLVRVLVYQWLFRRQSFAYRVVVVGAGPLARTLIEAVHHHLIRPVHHVVAVVDLTDGARGEKAEAVGVPVVAATTADVAQVVRGLNADVVLLALKDEEQIRKAYAGLRRLRFEGLGMLSALGAIETYAGRIPLDMVDEQWLWQASGGPAVLPLMRFKRIVDLLLVLLTLPITAVLAGLTALAVKLTSLRDPLLYSQERVGRFGRLFTIYKFRTMVPGAERDTGAVWSPLQDARVTPVGRCLRRYRLDELPQLVNVLRGDMSLVGPRPERPVLAADLERQIPYYRERENVPPGLTGWAQIRHPYGSSVEDSRTKLEYDLYYIQNLSLGLDLRVILRTLRIVLFGMEREVR